MQIKSQQLILSFDDNNGYINGLFDVNENHQLIANNLPVIKLLIDGKNIIDDFSIQLIQIDGQNARIIYQAPSNYAYHLQVLVNINVHKYKVSIEAYLMNLDQVNYNYQLQVLAPISLRQQDVTKLMLNNQSVAYVGQEQEYVGVEHTKIYTHEHLVAQVNGKGFNSIGLQSQHEYVVVGYNQYNTLVSNAQNSALVVMDLKSVSKSVIRRRIVSVVLLVLLLLSIFGLFNFTTLKYQPFMHFVEANYDGPIDDNVMQQNIYQGIMSGLNNPYSAYLTDEEWAKMENQIKQFGVGITVDATNYVMIKQVEAQSPASKANIYPGDYLESVNDTPITAYNAQEFFNIASNNDTIKLKLYRPSTNEKLEVSITKEQIPFKSITTKTLEKDGKKIGYIKIPEFDGPVADEFSDALTKFNEEQISDLFIDVCNNPGGDVKVVKQILDQLVVSDQPIFQFTKDGKVEENYYSNLKEKPNFKISVLQNQNSASASEILSLVLKEYADANIVGTRSFGKGTGQSVSKNPFGPGYIKVTAFHWQSGNGTSIEGKGVEPTIKVDQPYDVIAPIYLRDQVTLNSNGLNAYLTNNYLYYCGYDVDHNSLVANDKTINALNQFAQDNGIKPTGSLTPQLANTLVNKAQSAYNQVQFNPILRAAVDNV